jgi:hypothetical protein
MFHGTRRIKHSAVGLAFAALLQAACVGSIGDARSYSSSDSNLGANGGPSTLPGMAAAKTASGASASAGSATPAGAVANGATSQVPGGSIAVTCSGTPAIGPSPLRRLTHAEYDNTVADLLGDTTHPGTDFTLDTQVGLFDNTAESQTVPSLLADQYVDAATTLAQAANVSSLLGGCDPKAAGTAGTTCVTNFIDRFGRRAYRRPLSSAEDTNLLTLYTTTKTASDETTGVRAVLTALLVSPNFLFRPEFGADNASVPNAKKLSPYELAARMASLLWASAPDDTLLDAAKNGQLATSAQVATQARRLLADPKARPALATFYDQWLGVGLLASATKDPTTYPKWNSALQASMLEERRRFVDYVLWQDDAKLETLLSAPYSFLNAPLADLYGISSGAGADAATYNKVMLDPGQRAGVLTQPAMLAAFARPDESSPVKRGKWVRTRILCQDLPDPPAGVPQLPAVEPGVSNRERFAMHVSNPACSGCHNLIDGLGFGLEHYDSTGAYRTMDEGVPVDSSGDINSTADIDGNYDGGPELATLLASSSQVQDCAPTQWLRYAMGRRETDDDACSLTSLRKAFADSKGDLRELMVALTQTDVFSNYRAPD